MKGFAAILLVFGVASARENRCPPEQENDWTIEQLLEHKDCTKFYKCTYGYPVEMNCPSDLYFNIETWQCDWRYNVDCTDRVDPAETTSSSSTTTTTTTSTTTTATPTTTTTTPTTTTTTPTTTTTTPTTTTTSPTTTTTEAPEIDFLPNGCPVDPHIHWLLPHETDCNLFYYCVRGQKVLRACLETLHFNRVLQVCDWPADAGCTAVSLPPKPQENNYYKKTSLENDVEFSLSL